MSGGRAGSTCVNGLGRALEVKGEGEPVGEHGQRAPCLLVAGDGLDVHQPAAVELAAAAAHIHANLEQAVPVCVSLVCWLGALIPRLAS